MKISEIACLAGLALLTLPVSIASGQPGVGSRGGALSVGLHISRPLDYPVAPSIVARSLSAAGSGPVSSRVMNRLPTDDKPQGSLVATIGLATLSGLFGVYVAAGAVDVVTPKRLCGDSWCGFEASVIAGIMGLGAGAGLGAHLGNGNRGSLGLDVIGGLVGSAAAVGIISAGDPDDFSILVGALLAAVVVPIWVERSTARRNYERRRSTVAVAPTRSGIRVAVQFRLD